ncbi:MAG: riboflavin synthase [Firmicutes bacterium]|nr:riboflavin synthase [Bacillota bacterium]
MFTGIVEEIGVVKSIKKGSTSAKIIIKAKKILEDINLGDSISTNGVCLTVTDFNDDSFSVDVMPETIRKSSLRNLKKNSKVNLERALSLNKRLGGHIVSGHIDGVGHIKNIKREENAVWLSIKPPRELFKYIIDKGSIAIDGVSLTIAYVDNDIFKVSIIPHTKDETILLDKTIGGEINLECDMLAKYIEKLTSFNINKDNISKDFLMKNGFL